MDITYCNEDCPIGQEARNSFLESNNSAYDAVIDFWHFVDNCSKTCKYKQIDTENTKE